MIKGIFIKLLRESNNDSSITELLNLIGKDNKDIIQYVFMQLLKESNNFAIQKLITLTRD